MAFETDGLRRQNGDTDENDVSSSPTLTASAAETTPLLHSESASSYTIGNEPPPSPPQDEKPIGFGRGLSIALSMWALIFLQASNMSGISTIQSTIATDLDAYDQAMWFTGVYLISSGAVAPLIGRLSTIFTPGLMILISSFFFSAGSLVASQATTLWLFMFARAIVGVGGGGIMTLAFILVIQLTTRSRRGVWFGLTNAGFTIGMSTGAVVFGALLPVIGWRALFWGQAPLGLLAGLGVYASIPSFTLSSGSPLAARGAEKTNLQKLKGIDYAGAVTLTTTIVLLLYSLSGPTGIHYTPFFSSLLTFSLFLVIESRYASDPILPLRILRSRGILLSCLSQLGFMSARWTVLFYAPIFALAVHGASPALAGSILIPTNLGFGTGGLLVGWLHMTHADHTSKGYWFPSLFSMSVFGLAILAMGYVSNASTPTSWYVATIFVNGLATGAAVNYTMAHLLHLSHVREHFIVTGLLATFRGFAGSFGTAIGGGIFGRELRASLYRGFEKLGWEEGMPRERMEKLVTVLVGSPARVHEEGFLTVEERVVAVRGYENALRTLYQSAAVLCVVVLLVQAGTGWTAAGVSEQEEREIEEVIAEHDG
ncbi:major facilitator superfamily domain-containing protein [Pseudoneurospora amorphoporcata]|uniref:Major facilitator superfamily domain-containing protein n=1 Tax=Pseudoneurospora amorphoporcata TaxID=241081 RepID=A0AAN6P3G8_9PEZI|nr:major facilitator superfamily domain-containing protein [Pseudoneurospora amorphoporcata]